MFHTLLLFLLLSISVCGQSFLDYVQFIKATYGRNLSSVAVDKGLANFERNFSIFCKRYGKEYYNDEEIEYRKGNFLYSLDLINRANRQNDNGLSQYRLSLNRFADMGINENYFIGHKWINPEYIGKHRKNINVGSFFRNENTSAITTFPVSFDWRSKGAVTPVNDQGNCGSCFIFAGLSVIEGANAIAKNPLLPLSKQQIMDCVRPPQYVSDSCQGGTVDDVYTSVQQNGVVTEKVYPYTAKPGKCRSMASFWTETISSYSFLPINASDEMIMRALYSKGPLAAIINAGDRHFMLYSGGVLTSGGDRDLFGDYNHYITIVGFGTQGGFDYWLIKNSWGEDWGEIGYAKLLRGINNRGINTIVSYAEATTQKNNPYFNITDNVSGSSKIFASSLFIITTVILCANLFFYKC